MPFLDVFGERTFFVQRRAPSAQDDPVVLIHGAGGSHQHWLNQTRDLWAGRIYAPDLPGHGRSSGSGCDTIAGYAEWLCGFLDAALIQRTVLVGHSMGGAIALHMAVHYPERVSALGLVATGARLPVAPDLLDALKATPQQAAARIVRWAFGPRAAPALIQAGLAQMQSLPGGLLYGDFDACEAFDITEYLPALQIPALILCGTRDRMTPLRYSRHLRQLLADARLYVIEGAGHMVMLEKPEVVGAALSTFIACRLSSQAVRSQKIL